MTATATTTPLAEDLDLVLRRTQGLWQRVRGKTIFITGGTGFFGRWLLESFVEANHVFDLRAQAVVLSRNPEAFRARAANLDCSAIRLVSGDVKSLDVAAVQKQLGASAPKQFSFVIHAASETSVPANRDQPVLVLESLLTGTRRALDFAAKTGAESFLLTSSGAVYGEQPADMERLSEAYQGAPDISAPLSAYGEGKRLAELLCNQQNLIRGVNCKIARCFAFVGPHLALDAHYAIGNFMRDALAGNNIAVNGDGTPFRSYLYAADLAAWLWTILLSPKSSGTYNVGSDEAHSIREVAECVARNSPGQPQITVAKQPQPGQPTKRYVPDISRARRELGLEIWTPFEQAVQKTLEFHRQSRPI